MQEHGFQIRLFDIERFIELSKNAEWTRSAKALLTTWETMASNRESDPGDDNSGSDGR